MHILYVGFHKNSLMHVYGNVTKIKMELLTAVTIYLRIISSTYIN